MYYQFQLIGEKVEVRSNTGSFASFRYIESFNQHLNKIGITDMQRQQVFRDLRKNGKSVASGPIGRFWQL